MRSSDDIVFEGSATILSVESFYFKHHVVFRNFSQRNIFGVPIDKDSTKIRMVISTHRDIKGHMGVILHKGNKVF